jgi:hypothetical protein
LFNTLGPKCFHPVHHQRIFSPANCSIMPLKCISTLAAKSDSMA